jgi:DNA gyrase subunit A
MRIDRPNLSQVSEEVRNYIVSLEAEIEHIKREPYTGKKNSESISGIANLEPPTTVNVITATSSGIVKRTPRHLYSTQRRGGMGIFDMEVPESSIPSLLQLADESSTLLVVTEHAKSYRLPVKTIPMKEIRDKGVSIHENIKSDNIEIISTILPIQAQGFFVIMSRTGMVRKLRHHIFGDFMKPGTSLYDPSIFGPVAAACWISGDEDIFIAARSGRAIRFSSKTIPPQGCLGIRLSENDEAIAITPAFQNSKVLLLTADGLGTIRLMHGFNPNKSPGAGGKIAMKTSHLISAVNIDDVDDIFIISKQSKIIRFSSDEIPQKDGVVQGVNCMSFRGDEAVAVAVNQKSSSI